MFALLQFAPGVGHEVLMCPPTHFDLRYAINPQMQHARENGETVDTSRAFEQWMRLAFLLEILGARGRYLMPGEKFPDMVFTANAGLFFEGRMVVSNFAYDERRG